MFVVAHSGDCNQPPSPLVSVQNWCVCVCVGGGGGGGGGYLAADYGIYV